MHVDTHRATIMSTRPRHASTRRSSHVARFKLSSSSSRQRKRGDELELRKKYLINFWYAAGFTKDLSKGQHVVTRMLDTDLILWRDAGGGVFCATNACPITGCDLANFDLASDTDGSYIRDSASGLTYRLADGACSSLADQPDTGLRLEMWDLKEHGGFLWLFFGDRACPHDERPPVPWIPELDADGWKGVHGEVRIKANHWMVIENVIDMAHVPYVHQGTVGDHAQFVDIDIDITPTTLNFAFPIENHHAAGETPRFRVDASATACLPSTSFIRLAFPLNFRFVTINSVVPIDESTTVIRFCQMRNALHASVFDPVVKQMMYNILGEDKTILEGLAPEEVDTEVSLKADAPQMALRRMRERYIAAGRSVAPGARPLHSMPRADAMAPVGAAEFDSVRC